MAYQHHIEINGHHVYTTIVRSFDPVDALVELLAAKGWDEHYVRSWRPIGQTYDVTDSEIVEALDIMGVGARNFGVTVPMFVARVDAVLDAAGQGRQDMIARWRAAQTVLDALTLETMTRRMLRA